MAFADLREFILALEKEGDLLRISREVDWRYEVAAWTRLSYDSKPRRPALLFEKIKDYPAGYQIFTNGLGTYSRFARSLGLAPETSIKEIIQIYKNRVAHLIPPVEVGTGPVVENTVAGEKVDLFRFPVPWWHPRDGGRYIGTWHINVCKNPDTEITNVGCYRIQILDKNHALVGFLPGSHLGLSYSKQEARGEPLEMAVAIGADESMVMAAATSVPESVGEYEVAGGLRGKPVELIKCATVDLCIPAAAEIVLEGKLLPHIREPEGPFGEITGYHAGGVRMRTVFEVTAIHWRNNPILRGMLHGRPVDEVHMTSSIIRSASGLLAFEKAGPSGVKAIFCPPEGVPALGAIIQMEPGYVGHSRDVGRFWLASMAGGCKYVVLVDTDIDPFDLAQVWWAITTRTKASRDFEVAPFGRSSRSDPSVGKEGEYTDYLIIDATKKLDYPYNKTYGGHWAPVCEPPARLMELVRQRWQKAINHESEGKEEVEALTREIDDLDKVWGDWRKEAYSLTAEEKEAEASRSYPRLAGDADKKR
ncbi:MAG: UbiD family decarboxylase [Thermodesulfobacteriota bacterium]